MIKTILYILIGAILVSWGLMKIDVINDMVNMLFNNINLDLIAAFGEVYLKFMSYSYLMLLVAIIVVCFMLSKFIDWIKG